MRIDEDEDEDDLDRQAELYFAYRERQRRVVNRVIIGVLIAFLLLSFVVAAIAAPRTYNPAVTQETIDQTICVPGYTATVRPPYYVTSLIKKRLLEAQGLTWDDARRFELDHIIALGIGGEAGDIEHTSNFQLQPWPEARRKDRLEVVEQQCVCNRQVTLAEARADMEDWRKAYSKYARMICRRPR